MKCFLELKAQLTSEPVLKGPRLDSSPFIVTSNGLGHRFGGMLCQWFTTKLPSGKDVIRVHPIAFMSKHTSPTEEKYKAFLLEFMALKFSLDKFSDIIWGFPIKIETNCQALRDMMLKEKLTPAHARWHDSIMGHHIIDIQHILGKVNMVGDSISYQWAPGAEHTATNGSSWTVNPDWEECTGLAHDIFITTEEEVIDPLEVRFKKELLFVQVVMVLKDKDHAKSLRDRK